MRGLTSQGLHSCPPAHIIRLDTPRCKQSTPFRTSSRSCSRLLAKPSKAADFRQLSTEEIENEIRSCEMAFWQTRLKQNQREAYKSDQFGWNKHKVAQLKTVLREREIAEGIDRRESKRIEKRKKLASGYGLYY